MACVFSPPPQPVVTTPMPAEDAGWVLGRMLSTGQAARQRRVAEYQILLPASASESASPWQLALPDAPRTQNCHCSPATVIAASLAGGTDIFSRFRASLETGILTSELHPAQALSLLEQVACFKGWVTKDSTAGLDGVMASPGECTQVGKLRKREELWVGNESISYPG